MASLFASESVYEGHPDKVSDQISDALLDAFLDADPKSRVAVETMCTTGLVAVAGEVTAEAYVERIGRRLKQIYPSAPDYDKRVSVALNTVVMVSSSR